MKTYEPLKSPEYRRNERGQFDRPGKTLAKTQKKTGLTSKLIKKSDGNQKFLGDQSPREPDGRFKNGGARPGAGRPKGSPNKLSQSLKEMILASLDDVGGKAYLAKLAIENSSAYSALLGKILPHQMASAPESDGGPPVIRFERTIVYPKGHQFEGRHIEGKTPLQLPSPSSQDLPNTDPAASHALPNSTDPTDDTNKGAV